MNEDKDVDEDNKDSNVGGIVVLDHNFGDLPQEVLVLGGVSPFCARCTACASHYIGPPGHSLWTVSCYIGRVWNLVSMDSPQLEMPLLLAKDTCAVD